LATYQHIGKIAAAFGIKGELILLHILGKKTALKGLDALFIEIKGGELLPYFISSARIKSNTEIYLSLEGVDDREKALKLVARPVWLEESKFQEYVARSAPVNLVGYHIIDQGVDLGEILEVFEQPHQVLCRIDWKGKEALIPMIPDFIKHIDKKKRQVKTELPDGLLDIYES
jgi:16S rRNA processing protein RimM